MHKYYLYARKSSDSEDRQVLSIEAQIQELHDFALASKLEIVKTFTESMSAKNPGRPVFNQMLIELEQGNADGIISWHPDRLARNMYDGGRLLHLIDQGLVQDLKFPNFYFDKTANGKFNLSIAFSQAQYFIDGLRENVKRGIRQKVRRGEYPGKAPCGFINNPRTKAIDPDPEFFHVVKHYLERFADGELTQRQFRDQMYQAGIKGARSNKPLAYSSIYKIFTNSFYYGYFKLNGELHEGSHQAMITKETFDKIQKRLSVKYRDHNKKDNREFLFTNFAKCGECGYSITQEWHKRRSIVFKYYRCTHKHKEHDCTQRKYIREENLAEQVKNLVANFALPDDYYPKLIAKVEEWREEEQTQLKTQNISLEHNLDEIRAKLNRLLDLQLDGELELEEYKNKKNKLVVQKSKIQEKISSLSVSGSIWFESIMTFLNTCNQAHHSLRDENYKQMLRLLRKTGLNPTILNEKLQLEMIRPYDFLSEVPSLTGSYCIPVENHAVKIQQTLKESVGGKNAEERSSEALCHTAFSERFSASCPRRGEAEPRALLGSLGLGISEWYPQGNSNPCCTDENRVS